MRSLWLPTLAVIVVGGLALELAPSRGRSARSRTSVVASGARARIVIHNYAYDPQSLTVKAGTVITVTNTDQTAHTATANSGAFDTGTIGPGQTRHIKLTKPGVYLYHCAFHAFMTGTIKVVG